MVLYLSHPECTGHITPAGHPEQVARLAAVDRGLAGMALERRECPMGEEADILRCHPQRYIDRIRNAVPQSGWRQVDGDTFLSVGSWNAAMRAVGGMAAAVDHAVAGKGRAFLASRPPGHHAERETAMGFCLFGTAAIGAMRALDHHGLSRVAVLDFDVHHGNGTQDLLWDEARVRFISSHQMPLYPGTGSPRERGAHGQITNLPLEQGSGGSAMRRVWGPVLDGLAKWSPELMIISAGFDAHAADPLAGLEWEAEDFAWLTRAICGLGVPVVSTLEGGYDLPALAESVAAHVTELGIGE